MFDNTDQRRATLVAGLILLIVLAAVAAMSAGLDTDESTGSAVTRQNTSQRVSPTIAGQIATPAHGCVAQALDNANRFAVKPYSKGIRVILRQELAIYGKFWE